MSVKPRPRRSFPKGFTLPEILISTGILSLVLVACYALVVFALRWNTKMNDTVETYRRALKASSRISYDLGAGSATTFLYYPDDSTITTDKPGFAVASARPPTGPFQLDPQGRVLMQKWILYQVIGEKLYRNEIVLPSPVTRDQLMDPPTGPEPDYLTLRDSLSEPGSVQADNLTDFKVEGGASAEVMLEVEGDKTDDQGNKANAIKIQSRVNFR